ncbi:hypothetical protein Bca52824_073396 [Brassica carinata]|uniref:Uncharacterized protein n=1 Tax=Brassica carinata TaxID=52824 RepID=A0A8X7QA69_BRACI|nr:hypothetical protein Bca52824_073396 [Brassica carinata]
MSSSRNTSGSQRRGRQPSGEARTTTDGGTTREGQYLWKDKNCQVMLELVIAELKADDYRSRMPDVAARKRIEKKYFELIGTKRRLVHVLQKKPLPFKDLLDQIFGEHDVDQDKHVDGITMVDQLQETQTAEPIVDLTSDQGCNRSIRSMSSRRLARRKTSFETQVESGFQRVVDTRQEFLEELRSRKIQKITYGDATSVLEKLPKEQLGVFWWAANKLLKSDADIREERYDISTQRKVIFATMGLHNFIRWNKIKDIDFEEFDVGGDTTHSHSNVNNHSDDESDEQVNQNTSA